MIIDEIVLTNILVLLICLIGFILEIIKGLKYKKILKRIEINKLKKKIKILKNRRFQIDRLIIKRKNNKILWYFRTKLLRKINRNEKLLKQYNKNIEELNKINKNNNKINRINYKKILKIFFSTPLVIPVFYTSFSIISSYIFILIRYRILYNRLPSNLNATDSLNIMYRNLPYLFFIIIFLILSYFLYILEKTFLKINKDDYDEELKYGMYLNKEIINYYIVIILIIILVIYNFFRIVIFNNSIILPRLSLSILAVYSLKNIYYKNIGLIKFFILLPSFLFIMISIPEKYYEVSLDNGNIIKGILISDTKDRIKLIEREIEELNPELKIVEINKNNVIRIKEPDNVKVKFIPSCKNDRTCMDLLFAYEDNNKIFIKLFTSKENKENFKFDKNDKIIIKAYNIKAEKYDIINEIKYLEKYNTEENNVIYNEEGAESSIIIKLNKNKNYDYKNWRVFYIEKINIS